MTFTAYFINISIFVFIRISLTLKYLFQICIHLQIFK